MHPGAAFLGEQVAHAQCHQHGDKDAHGAQHVEQAVRGVGGFVDEGLLDLLLQSLPIADLLLREIIPPGAFHIFSEPIQTVEIVVLKAQQQISTQVSGIDQLKIGVGPCQIGVQLSGGQLGADIPRPLEKFLVHHLTAEQPGGFY